MSTEKAVDLAKPPQEVHDLLDRTNKKKPAKKDVEAMKKPDGTYYNPTGYQIISVGENGEQELDDLEASDDIRNFTVVEE